MKLFIRTVGRVLLINGFLCIFSGIGHALEENWLDMAANPQLEAIHSAFKQISGDMHARETQVEENSPLKIGIKFGNDVPQNLQELILEDLRYLERVSGKKQRLFIKKFLAAD